MKQTNIDVKKKGLALVKYFLQTPPYMQCLCNSFFAYTHICSMQGEKKRRILIIQCYIEDEEAEGESNGILKQ